MKKSTKKSIYLWGGSLLALALIVWGLMSMGGRHDSGTFDPTPLDLNVTEEFEQVKGAVDAPVTIVEYSDFQCPFCAQASPIIDRVVREYPDQVRAVYRHYPLRQIHPQAQFAAEAAEAAGRQGKFWEMHDLLFENQSAWGGAGARAAFTSYAEQLGLDVEQFKADLNDRAITQKVDNDYASGVAANVTGTPSFFVNGVRITANGYQGLVDAIEAELERIDEVAEATIEAGDNEDDPAGSESVEEVQTEDEE